MRSFVAALLIGAAYAQTEDEATTMTTMEATTSSSPEMDECLMHYSQEECENHLREGDKMGSEDDSDKDSDSDELFSGKGGKKIRTALEMVEMFCMSSDSSDGESNESDDEEHIDHELMSHEEHMQYMDNMDPHHHAEHAAHMTEEDH